MSQPARRARAAIESGVPEAIYRAANQRCELQPVRRGEGVSCYGGRKSRITIGDWTILSSSLRSGGHLLGIQGVRAYRGAILSRLATTPIERAAQFTPKAWPAKAEA